MKKLLGVLLFWLAINAQASIISNPATLTSYGSYFSDQSSGLDWLRVDDERTLYKSYNQVLADVSLQQQGWRYASGDELRGLLEEFGYIADTPLDYYYGPNANSGLTQALASYIGITANRTACCSGASVFVIHGLLSDEYTPRSHYSAMLQHTNTIVDFVDTINYSYTSDIDASSGIYNYYPWTNKSSFLVRSSASTVPEPSTTLLILAAALGMAGARYSRKSAS